MRAAGVAMDETKAEFDGRVGKINVYRQFNPNDTVLGLANASIARLHDGRVTLAAGAGWLYDQSGRRALLPSDTIFETVPKS